MPPLPGYTSLLVEHLQGRFEVVPDVFRRHPPPGGRVPPGWTVTVLRPRRGSAARDRGEELTLTFDRGERVIEGRLAYETGYFTLTRRGPQGERVSRGKHVVVMRFREGRGWSFQVDATSPVP